MTQKVKLSGTTFASHGLICLARLNSLLKFVNVPKFSNLNRREFSLAHEALYLRYHLQILVVGILGLAWSAPAPAPKALTLVSELKTPASTTKLAPLAVAPIAAPVIAPISRIAYAAPVLSQVGIARKVGVQIPSALHPVKYLKINLRG